jgi:hypothetical protein
MYGLNLERRILDKILYEADSSDMPRSVTLQIISNSFCYEIVSLCELSELHAIQHFSWSDSSLISQVFPRIFVQSESY